MGNKHIWSRTDLGTGMNGTRQGPISLVELINRQCLVREHRINGKTADTLKSSRLEGSPQNSVELRKEW